MFIHSRAATGRRLLVLALTPALTVGCVGPFDRSSDAESSLTIDGILARAENAYKRMSYLDAKGYLRDYRGGRKRVLPIRWELARPDRARVQIDMNLAIVDGKSWWSYDNETERFKSHREQGSAPIETAGYFLSDGVPFLTPAAWNRPKAVFGPSDLRSRWRLDGVAWNGGRPCYVISRDGLGRDGGSRWTLWIDQDRFLIVAWIWEINAPQPDGPARMEIVWGCTYESIVTDQPIAPERFRVERPTPIVLPRPAAGDAG